MNVAIVTDSCSDITQEEARKSGITVVPAWVRFGDRLYRDGVDIEPDEFFRRMTHGKVHPQTSAPSPGEFVEAYRRIVRHTREVVSIHVTRHHSVTLGAAMLAKDIIEKDVKGSHIEVIDSEAVTMWQGLVVYAAKRVAEAGGSLHQVADATREATVRIRGLAVLDTLDYAVKGGRLGKIVAVAEKLLGLKPLLTLRNGQIKPAGFVRKHENGIDKLHNLISSASAIVDMAIVHGTLKEEAEELAGYAMKVHPRVIPRVVRLGPAIGAHGGPKTLIAVVNQAG
jgi:DegV family protein with EDD domain